MDKLSYQDMISKACEELGPKFVSRVQIKKYLTQNFGVPDTPMAKLHIKKALNSFERKGDSYRISKAAGLQKKASAKAKAQKAKARPALRC